MDPGGIEKMCGLQIEGGMVHKLVSDVGAPAPRGCFVPLQSLIFVYHTDPEEPPHQIRTRIKRRMRKRKRNLSFACVCVCDRPCWVHCCYSSVSSVSCVSDFAQAEGATISDMASDGHGCTFNFATLACQKITSLLFFSKMRREDMVHNQFSKVPQLVDVN